MDNMESSTTVPTHESTPRAAFVVSLIAGIFVIVEGLIRLLQGRAIEVSGISDQIARRVLAGLAVIHIGAIALLFGALIIVGAILLLRTNMTLAGSLIVCVFSILSIVTGGLFGLLGFIVGIIGAILGLIKK